jgi:class 3 adenylate cyclase
MDVGDDSAALLAEKLSAEEEERVLGLMDDGALASISTMFMGREKGDMITVEQLTDIMAELQVAFDPDLLSRFVPDTQSECLTLHDTKVIIGRFVDMAQRNSAEQAKAENAVAVAQSAATVVHLDTIAYLAQMLPCASTDEGVTYKWNRPKVDVRPKTTLMVSVAGLMLLVTTVLVIVVVALSNKLIADQAHASSGQFAAAAEAVFQRLTDVGTQTVIAAAMQDAAASYASIVDGLLWTHESLVFDGLKSSLDRIAGAAASEATIAQEAALARLSAKLATTATIFATAGGVIELQSLLRTWETRDKIFGLAGTYSQTPLVAMSATLSAAGAGCTPTALALASCLANNTATVRQNTQRVCGSDYAFASVSFSRLGVAVCLMQPLSTAQSTVTEALERFVTTTNDGLNASGTYELQAAVRPVGSSAAPTVIGARRRVPAPCARVGTCPDLVDGYFLLALEQPNGTDIQTTTLQGYEAKEWMVAFVRVTVSSNLQLALLYTVDRAPVLEAYYRAVGQEVTVSTDAEEAVTPRNASLDAHITIAVFDRLRRIVLLPPGTSEPSAAEQRYLTYALNKRSGFVVPTSSDVGEVLAGYTTAPAAGIAVGMQMSNLAVGAATATYFTSVANTVNTNLPEGWEISVYRVDDGTLTLLTARRKASRCRAAGSCAYHPAAVQALERKDRNFVETDDYTGEAVLAWYSYDEGPPALIVVVEMSKQRWIHDQQDKQMIDAIIVGVVVLASIQVVIFLLTRRIMDRIELDYTRYKRRIEEEKAQFSDLVKDVMPPYIAERIMKGTRLIAETHPQLTFFFSDIVGSTETSKALTNKQLVRMLGYTFMLEDDVAAFYGVHKIKTIGDAYFAVSGLEDGTAGAATGKGHQVYRMVAFACVTQQLIGPGYTHFPERTECFRVSAGGQDLGPMRMVRMRMGIHTGPAVAGVVDVGRAPHFDCFGPSVNLASRMESTSTANRVQVSGPTMDILAKLDTDNLFEFDAPRRTLVKGYGTMTTYLVKSTNIHIPKSILEKLGIEHSNQRQFFGHEAAGAAGTTGSGGAASQATAGGPDPAAPMPQLPHVPMNNGYNESPPARHALPGRVPSGNSPLPQPVEQRPGRVVTPDSTPLSKDKKEKRDKRDKRDKRPKADAPPTSPGYDAPPSMPPPSSMTLLPDAVPPADTTTVPPGVPDFDMSGVPEPPPAFDPSAFDLPPPPPPL